MNSRIIIGGLGLLLLDINMLHLSIVAFIGCYLMLSAICWESKS